MSEQNKAKRMLIKDFKVPSPNGHTYDLSDPATMDALKKFCSKTIHYSEQGHPNTDDLLNDDDKIKRVMVIDLNKIVAGLTEIEFNIDESIITGLVTPVGGRMPFLLEQLERKDVIFGMRAFCFPNEASEKERKLACIVTFDVIAPGH